MEKFQKTLDLLVNNSTKHGVLLEHMDDNIQKLAEGFELLDGKVTDIQGTVHGIDERLIRVEANQIADREYIDSLKGRVTLLEKKI